MLGGGFLFALAFRTVFIYLFVILSVRIMGKRQIGELEPFELVVTVLISELAAIALENTEAPLFYAIVPVIFLVLLEWIVSLISVKSEKIRHLLSGRPESVIENGKLRQNRMRKLRMTVNELIEELRQQDITKIEEADYAVLETNGKLSVIKKGSVQTPNEYFSGTKKTKRAGNGNLGLTVIADGKFDDENLKKLSLDRDFFRKIVLSHGLGKLKKVFYMRYAENGEYLIIPKNKVFSVQPYVVSLCFLVVVSLLIAEFNVTSSGCDSIAAYGEKALAYTTEGDFESANQQLQKADGALENYVPVLNLIRPQSMLNEAEDQLAAALIYLSCGEQAEAAEQIKKFCDTIDHFKEMSSFSTKYLW